MSTWLTLVQPRLREALLPDGACQPEAHPTIATIYGVLFGSREDFSACRSFWQSRAAISALPLSLCGRRQSAKHSRDEGTLKVDMRKNALDGKVLFGLVL